MKKKQLYIAGIFVFISGYIIPSINAAIGNMPDSDQVVPLMATKHCDTVKSFTDSMRPEVTIESSGAAKCVRWTPRSTCTIGTYHDLIAEARQFGSVKAVCPGSQQANEALKRSHLILKKGITQQSILQDIVHNSRFYPDDHTFWISVHKASQQKGVQLIFGSRLDLPQNSTARKEFFQKSLDNIPRIKAAQAAMKKGYKFGRIANNLF